MENASKALIIAGAILLSILIISLGIMVFQSAKNTVGSANLSKQEIEAFNSQWESYVGNNKTASEVQTMVSDVIANNASEKTAGTNRTVKVGTSAASTSGSEPTSVTIVPSNNRYTIDAVYDTNTGLITELNWYVTTSGTT